jgi:hypothetical protein
MDLTKAAKSCCIRDYRNSSRPRVKGGGGGEAPTQLGPLDRANVRHWIFHLRRETGPVFRTLCSFWSIRRRTKSRNSAIPSVIPHPQYHWEFNKGSVYCKLQNVWSSFQSWSKRMLSTPSHLISLRFILRLTCHLPLRLPSSLSPW